MPSLGQIAFNILVFILEKTGILTKVEAVAVNEGDNFLRVIEHLKTYASPNDFPNPPPQDAGNSVLNNLNVLRP